MGPCVTLLDDFKQGCIISKKLNIIYFKSAVMSFMYTRKNNDPKIEPQGTPTNIYPQLEHFPFKTIVCDPLENYEQKTEIFLKHPNVLVYK